MTKECRPVLEIESTACSLSFYFISLSLWISLLSPIMVAFSLLTQHLIDHVLPDVSARYQPETRDSSMCFISVTVNTFLSTRRTISAPLQHGTLRTGTLLQASDMGHLKLPSTGPNPVRDCGIPTGPRSLKGVNHESHMIHAA